MPVYVIDDKEKLDGTVAVRARSNQNLGVMSMEDFFLKIAEAKTILQKHGSRKSGLSPTMGQKGNIGQQIKRKCKAKASKSSTGPGDF
jgi:hypothetical protein